MIPSRNWFPQSLQERSAWLSNFNTNIQVVGASLGLTAGELTSIGQDWENYDYLADAAVTLEAYVDAVRNYRRIITEGDIGDPKPAFPASLTLAVPFDTVLTGIFERLDNYVKRIRVAPAYTDEIGALLGIVTGSGGPSFPTLEVPPVLRAAVLPDNVVEVKFVKGESDGLYIETNIDNSGFAFEEKAVTSPAVFTVPQSQTGVPRGVQIRARFLDGNSPVGDWSDIVVVQTIP